MYYGSSGQIPTNNKLTDMAIYDIVVHK